MRTKISSGCQRDLWHTETHIHTWLRTADGGPHGRLSGLCFQREKLLLAKSDHTKKPRERQIPKE